MRNLSLILTEVRNDISRNLIIALMATLLMRGAFYLSLAILNHPDFLPQGITPLEQSLIFVAYPSAEILTVSFFGAISDRIGRRPIFLTSFLITAFSLVLLSMVREPLLMMGATALFGVGAAAKVTSTLALIADESRPENRGRNMGIYDMCTLTGLGGGFGLGFLLMEFFDSSLANIYFILAAAFLVILFVFTAMLLKETQKRSLDEMPSHDFFDSLKSVLKNPYIRKILPIWIPIICLYGILLNFAESLARDIGLSHLDIILVLGIVFGAILVGFPIQGHLSDKYGRKPFLYIGMISFALFVSILYGTKDYPGALLLLSPVLFIIGLGAGAFAPAALALLADVSESDQYGASMGTYSVIYGIGLIIGPITAAIAIEQAGFIGLLVVVWILAFISVIGTYLLPLDKIEQLKKSHQEKPPSTTLQTVSKASPSHD